MNDATRFTLAKMAVTVAGITGALMLTACSGGSATVSGRLDDTRYVPALSAITTVATHQVPTYTRQCTTKYRTSTTGSGKLKKTSRTSYQDCTNVRTGTHSEHYTRTIRAARSAKYCVELDDVNGRKSQDDQWFEVSSATYHKWAGKPEGLKVKKMSYLGHGCTH